MCAVSVLHPRSCLLMASEEAETPHDGTVGAERGRAVEHHPCGSQATGPGSAGPLGGGTGGLRRALAGAVRIEFTGLALARPDRPGGEGSGRRVLQAVLRRLPRREA